MAVNLIQKVCSNCGGKLKKAENPSEFWCENCKTEFILPTEQKKKLNRPSSGCPYDNGYDIVNKLSSIKRNRTVIDSFGYKQETMLASQITEPEYPQLIPHHDINFIPYKKSIQNYQLSALVVGGVFLIFFFITFSWLFIFLSVISVITFVYIANQKLESYKALNLNHHQCNTKENRERLEDYKYAITTYNDLYYCETHDLIFNNETREFFYIGELEKILYPNRNIKFDSLTKPYLHHKLNPMKKMMMPEMMSMMMRIKRF